MFVTSAVQRVVTSGRCSSRAVAGTAMGAHGSPSGNLSLAWLAAMLGLSVQVIHPRGGLVSSSTPPCAAVATAKIRPYF